MNPEHTRPKRPRSLFAAAARRYDLIHGALSLGRDRAWRRHAAALLHPPDDAEVLDVGTGTGALALAITERLGPRGRVVGCDIDEHMLSVARERVAQARAPIELVVADATALPFATARFDAVALGFTLDQVSDRLACARELFRVLAPGGRVVVLELALPRPAPSRALLPAAAWLLGPTVAPYGQLETEILRPRARAAVPELLHGVGFVGHRRERAAAGVVSVYVADKPRR